MAFSRKDLTLRRLLFDPDLLPHRRRREVGLSLARALLAVESFGSGSFPGLLLQVQVLRDTDVLFLNARELLLLNILFVLSYKVLSDLLVIDITPSLLHLFDAFLVDNLLEDVLARPLVLLESLLRDDLLQVQVWELVQSLSVPEQLLRAN